MECCSFAIPKMSGRLLIVGFHVEPGRLTESIRRYGIHAIEGLFFLAMIQLMWNPVGPVRLYFNLSSNCISSVQSQRLKKPTRLPSSATRRRSLIFRKSPRAPAASLPSPRKATTPSGHWSNTSSTSRPQPSCSPPNRNRPAATASVLHRCPPRLQRRPAEEPGEVSHRGITLAGNHTVCPMSL